MPVWNQRMLDLAMRVDFEVRLCRPYRAQTKGKAESGVKYVKGNMWPSMINDNQSCRWTARRPGSRHTLDGPPFASQSELSLCLPVLPAGPGMKRVPRPRWAILLTMGRWPRFQRIPGSHEKGNNQKGPGRNRRKDGTPVPATLGVVPAMGVKGVIPSCCLADRLQHVGFCLRLVLVLVLEGAGDGDTEAVFPTPPPYPSPSPGPLMSNCRAS